MAATEVTMRVWRGDAKGGAFVEYRVPSQEGMVVLDVIHTPPGHPGGRSRVPVELQGGQVRLVQRRDQRQAAAHVHDPDGHVHARRDHHGGADEDVPDLPRPRHRRVVQLREGQDHPGLQAAAEGGRTARGACMQADVERSQEFRKCIECFMCQDVCHVIRDHPENKTAFAGPRYLMRLAELEMHPLDTHDRNELITAQGRARLLQHHQVLHRGVPRAHPHHGQCPDPAQGAGRHRVLRPRGVGVAEAHGALSAAVKIHEYQAKEILRQFGVPVPKGEVAETPAEARHIAQAPRRPGGGEGAGPRGGARQGRRASSWRMIPRRPRRRRARSSA